MAKKTPEGFIQEISHPPEKPLEVLDYLDLAIGWIEDNKVQGNHPARAGQEVTLGQLRAVKKMYQDNVLSHGHVKKG